MTGVRPVLILLATALSVTAYQEGDYTYTVSGGKATVTDFSPAYAGALCITNKLSVFPVVSIGSSAFRDCTNLTSVTIPASVTAIGGYAFYNCAGLTTVTIGSSVTTVGSAAFAACSSLTIIIVDPANPSLSSLDGVLFDKARHTLILCAGGIAGHYTVPSSVTSIRDLAFHNCARLTSVMIGNSVTSIGAQAFLGCHGLLSVTVPASVTTIESSVFANCSSLRGVYFAGNTPSISYGLFDGSANVIVYYLPGTTGWISTFASRPTALWTPLIAGIADGGRTNGAALKISWASGRTVVVEACTNLTGAAWLPLETTNLVTGSLGFCDPESTNYPARFYRVTGP